MSDALILLHTAIAIVLIVLIILVLRIGPVIALVLGSIYLGLAAGLGGQGTAEAIAQGFCDIMTEVGLLIAFGVLLGSLLAAMGTLERLVETLLGAFGPRRLPYASSVALTAVFPVIYGDVYRAEPMTVEWARYAQSLTDQPVKGMLTGPVTMLQWSFARDDQPRETTALQIAAALRDEVRDLELAGIAIIQIDEPAFREGLPLKRRDWPRSISAALPSR